MSFMKNINNPKQFVLNAMMNNNRNPIINQLIDMAQNGNVTNLEAFAKNFCRERNIDFDSEFSKFMSQFKR